MPACQTTRRVLHRIIPWCRPTTLLDIGHVVRNRLDRHDPSLRCHCNITRGHRTLRLSQLCARTYLRNLIRSEEIKDEYRSIYASALNRYDELGGDLSKLRTDYCCSVLFVAFDNYQPKSSKAKEVKPVLRNAILGNPNWRVQGQQWNKMEKVSTNACIVVVIIVVLVRSCDRLVT